MKNALYIVLAIVVMGLIALFFLGKGGGTDTTDPTTTATAMNSGMDTGRLMEGSNLDPSIDTPPATDSTGGMEDGTLDTPSAAHTFDISAKNFTFSQKEIRVKKGDRVHINLTVTEGFHDLTVEEFDARTSQIGVGKTSSLEFIAEKTGTFEYYCSVGTHRQMGMTGKLIVE